MAAIGSGHMSIPPLTHLGHWYLQIAFAAPALVIISYMVLTC